MVVGVGVIEIFVVNSRSLKEKRGVLRRILHRTKNKFNVSIAEIGDQDSWKRGKIGFSVVGNDTRFVNSVMDTILRYVEDLKLAEIVNTTIEITAMSNLGEKRYGCRNGKYDEF